MQLALLEVRGANNFDLFEELLARAAKGFERTARLRFLR